MWSYISCFGFCIIMVKVFKCHNFQSQNVIQVDGEPVAVYNSRDKLFVATDKCCIEVFSLGSSISKLSCFSSTESTIHNIIYSLPGMYFNHRLWSFSVARECKYKVPGVACWSRAARVLRVCGFERQKFNFKIGSHCFS